MTANTNTEEEFLGFLEYPDREQKPRENGKTMVMASASISEDFLRRYAQYIDIVKLLDSTQWARRDIILDDISLYKEYNIDVQVGGVPHEVARLQNKEERYFQAMTDAGIDWIEYETHVEKPSKDEVENDISRLKDLGFKIAGEVGSKWYWDDDTRLSKNQIKIDNTIKQFELFIDAGCDKVYWEGLVVGNLIGRNLDNREGQKAIKEVVESVGTDNLFFEIWAPEFTSLEHGKYWSWLIHEFGSNINIANVHPHSLPLLESNRRGVLFDMDHPYIRWLKDGKPTEKWWEINSPPYDVGINPE